VTTRHHPATLAGHVGACGSLGQRDATVLIVQPGLGRVTLNSALDYPTNGLYRTSIPATLTVVHSSANDGRLSHLIKVYVMLCYV